MKTETKVHVVVTDAMHAEGIEIAKIVTRRTKTFKRDIADDGWVVRLGNLMLELEAMAAEAGYKKIPSAMLKDVGLDKVSSAIRCEAKWFAENTETARSFIKASKKGYANVSSLKSDMAKAAKLAEKDETTEGGTTESETTEGGTTESETTEGEVKVELSVPAIAVAINALASRDGKSVKDVLGEIVDLFAETDPIALAA